MSIIASSKTDRLLLTGHNGAGKTTLFNMLTGMTSPSAGTAYIYGLDIKSVFVLINCLSFHGKLNMKFRLKVALEEEFDVHSSCVVIIQIHWNE
jgi:ABC-type multidrug transport system ATPase subunit